MSAQGALVAAFAVVVALVVAAPAAAEPSGGAAATRALWGTLTAAEARGELRGASIRPERYRAFELAEQGLARAFTEDELVLSIPHPDGGFERFRLEETPVLEPGLAAKHPDIRTFTGTGIDDPSATVHADLTPLGFHASVRSTRGWWYVDPSHHRGDGVYVSYHARDLENVRPQLFEEEEIEGTAGDLAAAVEERSGPAVTRRVFRLALVSDPSYFQYFGSSNANVTAAKATLVSRVNQIYEAESAIRLVLAAGNDALNLNTNALATGANGPCGAEPCYTADELAGCGPATLHWTRIVIGQLLPGGASSYDVGHLVLGKNGGGIAGLGVVGEQYKAHGCTGIPNPVGDFFAVDYVAHELGHQFGAPHSFNGVQGNCAGGNRTQSSSVEPGSGSSIMAYAGICGTDNLQPHTDPYWSQRSRGQIAATVGAGAASLNEVQTVSLTGFGGTDSFRLRYDGVSSALITNGSNYSPAGIKAAIEGIAGLPVTVSGFGELAFSPHGFQVRFGGAAADRLPLSVVSITGATGFVGETDKGGPTTHGGTQEATGNSAPDVNVVSPNGVTVPARTPFALAATGSDPDGDTVTYLWEQNDPGTGSGTALFSGSKTNGPLFRVFGTPLLEPPYVETEYNSPGVNVLSTEPTRVFPDLAQILSGNTNAKTGSCPASNVECFSEWLPTSAYSGPMHFRVTARDGKAGGGGIATADITVNVATSAGPFLVTSHADPSPRTGGDDDTVTWNVAGTAGAPVSAANVRISLSVDGGLTYPHELAASTPNDGSQVVTLPDVTAAAARIKVEGVGNVFFDLNDTSFAIEESTGAPNTTIGSGPAGFTNEPSPTFAFTSRAGATFECRLDAGAWDDCTSPHTIGPLADGEYTFEVQATEGGETDATPAVRVFTVDTVAPEAPSLSGPSGQTGVLKPTYTFTSEPGATFACRVDGGAFLACASPRQIGPVSAGAHTFRVRATDEAGNTGAEASAAFTYVPPPNTKMGTRRLKHGAKTATFRFTGSGGIGARTFQCRLTGAKTTNAQRAWSKCAAPKRYRRLKPGLYTFHVRARDATGRVDPTPAKSGFRMRRV